MRSRFVDALRSDPQMPKRFSCAKVSSPVVVRRNLLRKPAPTTAKDHRPQKSPRRATRAFINWQM